MGNELVRIGKGGVSVAMFADLVPAIVERAGGRARRRWVEFFTAELTNDNTRQAYALAISEFFDWFEEFAGVGGEDDDLYNIKTEHVAAYREWLVKTPALVKGKKGVEVEKARSVTTVKLKLSAIRSLFRYLKEGGILSEDPAASVRAPKFSRSIGATAVLDGNEAARILDKLTEEIGESIEKKGVEDLVALRDRALIAVMTFAVARVSAAVGMKGSDVFLQGNRRHVRLLEKGGKRHVMPCHHELDDYLMAYMEAAGSKDQPGAPLFRAVDNKTRTLGPEKLSRMKAWEMVQRRAKAAGVSTAACNHTFRATGITTFLENGGTIEKARDMAAHTSIRTTQLYDRRSKAVKVDDVVLINLRRKAIVK